MGRGSLTILAAAAGAAAVVSLALFLVTGDGIWLGPFVATALMCGGWIYRIGRAA